MDQYKDAAIRHYSDATFLRTAGRLDNAGHLIGFSAECAIKHAIETVSSSADKPRGHLPDFLGVARKHLNSRSPMYVLLQSNLLSGWRVDRRYHASGETTANELDAWTSHARRLLGAAGIKERQ